MDDVLTWCFIVVDIDPVQLQVTVTMVSASWVNAMLITDHLPKLKYIQIKGKNEGAIKKSD